VGVWANPVVSQQTYTGPNYSGAGGGGMQASIYDSDEDGRIDHDASLMLMTWGLVQVNMTGLSCFRTYPAAVTACSASFNPYTSYPFNDSVYVEGCLVSIQDTGAGQSDPDDWDVGDEYVLRLSETPPAYSLAAFSSSANATFTIRDNGTSCGALTNCANDDGVFYWTIEDTSDSTDGYLTIQITSRTDANNNVDAYWLVECAVSGVL
jgi:hypothetical protein